MSTVVKFENVSKRYTLGTAGHSLREAISSVPGRLVRRGNQETRDDKCLWALRDVNFEVEQGQVLGIIGPNGAGKTTALKLLSRVTMPTTGQIQVNGRVSAL